MAFPALILAANLAVVTDAQAQTAALAPADGVPGDDDRLPRQLPENSAASHPPTAAPVRYTISREERVRNGRFADGLAFWEAPPGVAAPLASDARPRGTAVAIKGTLLQKLASGTLEAGKAYTLTVVASKGSAESAFVAVRLREPKTGTTYRTYRGDVTAAARGEIRVDFTAPLYTEQAEVALVSAGGSLEVDSVSLRMREPIAVTEPVERWDHSYTPPGVSMVFNDEFDGPAVNRRKWYTRYISGSETLDRLNDENQRYTDNDNHQFADGAVKLVARKKPLSAVNGINYESGMLRSDWVFRYGFIESRIKMPPGRGTWAAFWLNSDVGETGRINWPPEIDIFEYVDNGKDDLPNKIHIAANTPKGTQPVCLYMHPGFKRGVANWVAPYDFSADWHTFGLDWQPDRFSVYVDGVKVMSRLHTWTYADGVVGAPAHILLNLAIGGAWAGRYGIDDALFPRAMEVDWVRAYRKTADLAAPGAPR